MKRPWVRRVSAAAIAVGVLLTTLVAVRFFQFDRDCIHHISNSLRIYDNNGELLREIVNGEGSRTRWQPLAEISPLVVQATLAAEDQRFFEHWGVDPQAVVRAFRDNLKSGRVVSGASTVTMQLARLIQPHPRTLLGKLGEMIDAARLETLYSKEQILEHYLNRAFYGAGSIGVEAASHRYFGKPSLHLSLAEAALISGLPKAPSDLNPLRDKQRAQKRQRWVLTRMRRSQKISQEELELAQTEPLQLRAKPPQPYAMHFTDYVVELDPEPGEVHTTLDLTVQKQIEQMVGTHVKRLAIGGMTNAAVVVLDNRHCDILAMVGSSDYWESNTGSVNGALAKRQPGSALKPFTYGLAFEAKMTPASVVADVETRYGEANGRLFEPKNYSGKFSGPVLAGKALGRSLNVPAIRVANYVGVDKLLDRLHQLGFDSLDQSAEHYGLGLTLGNGEVTLLELAQAYATLARGGRTCQTRALKNRPATESQQAFSPQISFLLTSILSDETARIQAFGPNNPLLLGFPVAVKTGTSGNWRDSWAVGYTEQITVAIWAGDFSSRPMHQIAGAIGAGPLFHKVMKYMVHRDRQQAYLSPKPPPRGVYQEEVCALSGQRPSDLCPNRQSVMLLSHQLPTQTCDWHQKLKIDLRNGLLAGDRCPREHVVEKVHAILPARFHTWQIEHHRTTAPTRYSPLCPARGTVPNALVITYPRSGEVFLVEPGYSRQTQTLEFKAEVSPPQPEVTWILDGQPMATVGWPYLSNWSILRGKHKIELVASGKRSDPVEFEVR